ncbi:hypothetical protein DMB66_19110 [Actinoplanes sp. ATCC 53533]|nr:hypothetical protein DMB66_19110 [Actinoplanes sp. ATCC 53533]
MRWWHAYVDDVVQETLIRIVRDLPALRDPDRFRGWVVAIANRQLQLYLWTRRKTSQHQQELAADVPDPGSDFAAGPLPSCCSTASAGRWSRPPAGWPTTIASCCPCGGRRRPARSPARTWPRPSTSRLGTRPSG